MEQITLFFVFVANVTISSS